ncbi:hypothetical protein LTSEJOH_2643 [Salmonella enterica subsp. enterica serovar Johannesburg str. S5-703]|nr:hypothetical protein LTSEJOH_2643 [Salmonella enterica subsp. enterica serovar Johannesburg str. S5-703]
MLIKLYHQINRFNDFIKFIFKIHFYQRIQYKIHFYQRILVWRRRST